MQMKAFRLDKYENCGNVLKYFDAFELYRLTGLAIGTLNISLLTSVKDLHSYTLVLMKNKQLELCFTI